jgi:hypothetical protein
LFIAYRRWEKTAASRREELAALMAALSALTAAMQELSLVTKDEFSKINTVVDDANKFITGTTRACEAIADATVSHMRSVKEFSALLKAPEERAFGDLEITADSRSSRIGGDMIARILQGDSPSEARARAESDEEERIAIGAVSFS